MLIDRIRTLRLSPSFQPFYVIMSDGQRLLVDLPHHLAMAPDGSRLGIVTRTGVTFLNPEDVRDVDVLPVPLKKQA